jgi:Ion channel
MFVKWLIAWGLMASCVVVHAIGLTMAVRWARRRVIRSQRLWQWTQLFVELAGWVVLLHVIEITSWALFFAWTDAIPGPGLQRALYFSAVTYTTTGYGDVLLSQEWQLVGTIEALTGILMCGWSTGFFLAIVNRMYGSGDVARADPRR